MWNEVNKQEPLFVVFTSKDFCAETRNTDFIAGTMLFEHVVLCNGSVMRRLRQMTAILRSRQWTNVICGGWDSIEFIWPALLSPRKKNVIIVESSIYESKTTGFVGFMKRLVLGRMGTAFVSGIAQKMLMDALRFNGRVLITGGCGLLCYVDQPQYEAREDVKNFLYVGRLIGVKNLKLLIEVFNDLPDLELTIAGEGPLRGELESIASSNIHFIGYVPNTELSRIYKEHDVFVLPSLSEPWGLVVEEALNNGCPVLLSDVVGCNIDFISYKTGRVFNHTSKASLFDAINSLRDIDTYNQIRYNITKMDFKQRAEQQVRVYFE